MHCRNYQIVHGTTRTRPVSLSYTVLRVNELTEILSSTCTTPSPIPAPYSPIQANGNCFDRKGRLVDAALWTQLECHSGLIVSCFPAVNQIFRQWVVRSGSSIESDEPQILRRVVPGMYSIDTPIERGLKTETAACRDVGSEAVVFVDVGEIISPPRGFSGAWGGRGGYSNHC